MRKYILGGAGTLLLILSLFFILSWKSPVESNPVARTASEKLLYRKQDSLYHNYIKDLYDSSKLAASGLNRAVFEKAVTGFYNLKLTGRVSGSKSIISIADLDQVSTAKRLWIIDLNKQELLLNTWVAHGQYSGYDKATHFSNADDSYQSSLGFYVTGEIYNGKHGRSLKLDGMDNGYNDNARERSIVIHGAPYVSQETIDDLGRLGRSQGCPAVAAELSDQVIDMIKNKTVLFINGDDQYYTSKFLNEHMAAYLAIKNDSTTNKNYI